MREMKLDSEIHQIGSSSNHRFYRLSSQLSLPEERPHHDEHPHLEIAVDVVLGRVEDGDDGADEHPVEGGDPGAGQIDRLDFQ